MEAIKVRYIGTKDYGHSLTQNKEYDVRWASIMTYKITNDLGITREYINHLFEIVEAAYDLNEIFGFSEGTEFISDGITVKIENKQLLITKSNWNEWSSVSLTKEWVNARFTLIKQDKEVCLEEALNQYRSYQKTIYCIWSECKYTYKFNEDGLINTENRLPISATEILEGKWFLEA